MVLLEITLFIASKTVTLGFLARYSFILCLWTLYVRLDGALECFFKKVFYCCFKFRLDYIALNFSL